jgi:hypothetical protein
MTPAELAQVGRGIAADLIKRGIAFRLDGRLFLEVEAHER